jgi:acyl-CoA thioesterase-1
VEQRMLQWFKKLAVLVSLGFITSVGDAYSATATGPTVVFLGDDAFTGKGLAPTEKSFAKLLDSSVGTTNGSLNIRLINLSREGETAESLVGRINEILSYQPAIVVMGVGLNDALAQTGTDVAYGNLETVLNALYGAKVNVLLLGIKAPSSLPDDYELAFNRIYADLASRYQVYFIPNIMDGIFTSRQFSQNDGIMPNAAGAKRMFGVFMNMFRTMLGDYTGLVEFCRVNPTNPSCQTIVH